MHTLADLKFALQVTLVTITTFCSAMTHLLGLLLAIDAVNGGDDDDDDALDMAIESVIIILVAYMGILRTIRIADGLLFDIPLEEEEPHFLPPLLVRGQ